MTRFLTLLETIVAILVLAFTVCPALGVAHAAPPDGNTEGSQNITAIPHIQFDEKFFDVGKVDQHKTVTHLFTFKNTGSGTLIIQRVKAT